MWQMVNEVATLNTLTQLLFKFFEYLNLTVV